MREDVKEKLRERRWNLMKKFKPDSDVIKKIISLNDGLYNRFRMVYDDIVQMKKTVDEEIKSGRVKISGYTIFPRYYFGYNLEDGIPTADYATLIDMNDYTEDFFYPNCSLSEDDNIPDFDTDFIDDDPKLSWNIELLDLPGLEKHYIHYFMHTLFVDSDTFCPADIPYLKPEDLQWQVVVHYEFFNK